MAFRRRFVRSRAPRRRYLGFRKRAKTSRRSRKYQRRRTGNFTILCRKTTTHLVTGTAATTVQISPKLKEINEASPFIAQFEAYRIHSVTVRVRPHFNFAEAESPVSPYYIAPWHKPVTNINAEVIRSIDKCRTYNGTSVAKRSFVPCVISAISDADKPDKPKYGKTNWRPRIEIVGEAADVAHYCGVIYFSGSSQATPQRKLQYELETTCKVTFYNQKHYV
uniref:Capsid protein n=1 Tax=Rousettus bat circovirus TaxID=3141902 RepID=A0AAU7E291_9CIRC